MLEVKEGLLCKTCIPRGHALVFKYVRGDGTPSQFESIDTVFT